MAIVISSLNILQYFHIFEINLLDPNFKRNIKKAKRCYESGFRLDVIHKSSAKRFSNRPSFKLPHYTVHTPVKLSSLSKLKKTKKLQPKQL